MKDINVNVAKCKECFWFGQCPKLQWNQKCIHFVRIDDDGFPLNYLEEYLEICMEQNREYNEIVKEYENDQ